MQKNMTKFELGQATLFFGGRLMQDNQFFSADHLLRCSRVGHKFSCAVKFLC